MISKIFYYSRVWIGQRRHPLILVYFWNICITRHHEEYRRNRQIPSQPRLILQDLDPFIYIYIYIFVRIACLTSWKLSADINVCLGTHKILDRYLFCGFLLSLNLVDKSSVHTKTSFCFAQSSYLPRMWSRNLAMLFLIKATNGLATSSAELPLIDSFQSIPIGLIAGLFSSEAKVSLKDDKPFSKRCLFDTRQSWKHNDLLHINWNWHSICFVYTISSICFTSFTCYFNMISYFLHFSQSGRLKVIGLLFSSTIDWLDFSRLWYSVKWFEWSWHTLHSSSQVSWNESSLPFSRLQ